MSISIGSRHLIQPLGPLGVCFIIAFFDSAIWDLVLIEVAAAAVLFLAVPKKAFAFAGKYFDKKSRREYEYKMHSKRFAELTDKLMLDLKAHSQRKEAYYKSIGQVAYSDKYAKPIIDKIDRTLAKYYNFTEEELDFIFNCDIKCRMGKDSAEEDA